MIPSVNSKNIPLNVGERYEVFTIIFYSILKNIFQG